MDKNAVFEDFDDEAVYHRSRERALRESSLNFVVEFGKDKARIAFDLGLEDVKELLVTRQEEETPVRWM